MSWLFMTEWVLYVSFGLLAGSQILQFVPATHRPTYHVPDALIRLSILVIAIFSFFPLLRIVFMFSDGSDVGFGSLFETVLIEFNVGQAWIVTLLACGSLLVLHSIKKLVPDRRLDSLSAILTLILFMAFAWASHCTVSYEWKGFAIHGIHFLAVSVWMGILLVVGWFAQNHDNWVAFLRWFTPLAITCFLIALFAGLALMSWLVPDVVNAWIVSYGQALLFKHLLIVPLLVFGLLNSVYVRHRVKHDATFRPLRWVRAESVSGMAVFAAMAVMGQQSPTENLKAVIEFEKPSRLFEWFYPAAITQDTTIHLQWTVNGVLIGLLAFACLLGMILFVIRGARPLGAISFGLLFVVCAYLAVMFSVH